MPPLLLYLVVAVALLAAWNRWVTPLSRGAAIVLILLPLLFTGHAMVTNRAYGGFDILLLCQPFSDYGKELGFRDMHNWMLPDHVLQLAPWQHQVRESFARGEWPLWNPAMMSGQVLAGNMQSAPYDPANLIALLLPLDLATTFGAALTLLFAALFTFACARDHECSEGASLIAATAFTMSSGMAFNAGWPLGRSWTMLPFVLLGIRRVVRDRDAAAFTLLTIAFSLLILTGHPETLLHIVAVGMIYGIYELFPVWRKAWRDAWRPIALAAGAGVLSLLITAIFLLPFIELLPASSEYLLRNYATFATADATAAEVWRIVRATFIPYYGGASWLTRSPEWDFGTARTGSIVVALAAIALVRLWRQRDVRFLIVLGAVTMLAACKAWPVATLLRELPLFGITRNDRLAVVTALVLALLAAKAFDARATLRRDRWIVILVGAGLAAATVLLWQKQLSWGVDRRLPVAGAAAELFGIVLLLIALSVSSRRTALAMILAALFVQRFVEEGNIYPVVPRHQFYPRVPLTDAIPRDPMYRVTATGNLLIPNVATMYGLEDIRGYEAMTLQKYLDTRTLWAPRAQRSYHDVNDLTRPFLSFLGVRHAITPRTTEPPPGWRVVMDDRTTRLMENTRALPRVFVPRRIRYVDNYDQALEEMAQASDFAETAWIETREMPPHESHNGDAVVRATRIGSSRYEIDVQSTASSRVVIAEAAWPGWRAYIDGRRVRMAEVNAAFLSVFVPEGRHRLKVVYLPEAFVRGRAITFATLALLAAIIAIRKWRGTRT